MHCLEFLTAVIFRIDLGFVLSLQNPLDCSLNLVAIIRHSLVLLFGCYGTVCLLSALVCLSRTCGSWMAFYCETTHFVTWKHLVWSILDLAFRIREKILPYWAGSNAWGRCPEQLGNLYLCIQQKFVWTLLWSIWSNCKTQQSCDLA